MKTNVFTEIEADLRAKIIEQIDRQPLCLIIETEYDNERDELYFVINPPRIMGYCTKLTVTSEYLKSISSELPEEIVRQMYATADIRYCTHEKLKEIFGEELINKVTGKTNAMAN